MRRLINRYIICSAIIFSLLHTTPIEEGNIEEKIGLKVEEIGNISITKDILPYSKEHRPMISMFPKYITIHNTDNEDIGADANMHSRYLKMTEEYVSWHYTVDDGTIIQHLPLNEIGYHAGDGMMGDGNMHSIAIEICENADGDYVQAEKNAAKLVAALLYEYKMDISQVVPHNHWSGKDCPHNMLSKEKGSLGWEGFRQEISRELSNITLNDAKSSFEQIDALVIKMIEKCYRKLK